MSKFIINGGKPLRGHITPSGNKNEALPAIIACLLSDEPVILENTPKIKDVITTCEILERLGVACDWIGHDTLQLNAAKAHSYKPDAGLCSHIRASILFLGPLLARFGKVELPPPGGDVIGARKIDSHFEGISALGAQLEFGKPIKGSIKAIKGGEVFLDEPSVTATENFLMLAVRCQGTTVLHNAAAEPHVVGLCHLLNKMGAKITGIGSNRLDIIGVEKLHGARHRIGPDFMEVGSFLCLGSALSEGELSIGPVSLPDMRFVLKTFARLGIHPEVRGENLHIKGGQKLSMMTDIGGRVSTIYSAPWPAFPTDLMSVAIVAATQSRGTMIFHEKMFEGRMFFTDKLMAMGANIVLCDPHRIVITGPNPLTAANMSSPDVRAGMAMVIAALIAKGTSVIDNIYQIERGYCGIFNKLTSIGADIVREGWGPPLAWGPAIF